ncbi:MAG: NADH:ubiquinone reductase (Na(+)-transporting) subunit D [Gemmatimonadales bacterium]
MNGESKRILLDPLIENNPLALQMLGICPALAVTTQVSAALTMGIAVTAVLACASVVISLIRRQIPTSIRMIIMMTVIATLVIVVDQMLKAYMPEMSQRLSVFVGLIITNCIVLGRAESFASKNRPWPSLLDGLGNGLGFALIILLVGSVRELLGSGTLLGQPILASSAEGGWYVPNGLMLLPPSAFFVLGGLIWLLRTWKPSQVEKPEYQIHEVHRREII